MKEDKKYYFIATEASSLYTIKNNTEELKNHGTAEADGKWVKDEMRIEDTQGFGWVFPNKIPEPVYKGDYLTKEGNQYYIDRIDTSSFYDTKDPNKEVVVHLKMLAYYVKEKQLTDKDVEELIFNKELVEIPETLYDKDRFLNKLIIAEQGKLSSIIDLSDEINVDERDFDFDEDFSRKDLEEIKKAKQIEQNLEIRDMKLLRDANKYLEEYISNEKEIIIAKSFENADKKFIESISQREGQGWAIGYLNSDEVTELYKYSQKVYDSAKYVFDIEKTRYNARYITNIIADSIFIGNITTQEALNTPINQVIENIQRIIKNQEEQNIEINDESVEETEQGEDFELC